jgi:predicted TIM-barrel fold metal-dependent hydrolase
MNRNDIIDKLSKKRCVIDAHAHVGISINNYSVTNSYPYCLSIEDLLVRMDFLGVDRTVVFPFESTYFPFLGDDKRLETQHFSTFPYENENRNLFTEIFHVFKEHSERFIPFAMFDPTHETDKQATALDALNKEFPICGLKTVTTYIKAFAKDFLKPDNKIRVFAEKHKFPLVFHTSIIENDPWANVFDVLDIVKALPELNFALAHSVRFSKKALDMAASLPNCFVDISAFNIHCDLAVDNSPVVASKHDRFDADYHNPASVLEALATAYPGTIIWGTDTPYHYFAQKYTDADGKMVDVKLLSSYKAESEILYALPETIREEISYTNIMKFLNKK